ncbi:51df190b-7808-476b-a99f-dffb60a7d76f [Thermothielavioides terrestris]|uniref:51df190b-7808-476b-a99f-dffb60a7d76f n=1 Tax=Thermothielavioides terrestris TaxID=2587410 RepID=A0A3S4C501_9PEZI|nr:51df190b-7808-476b-a99f-dffb60a7d76f [Thermothielavioides terrestris]
MSFETVRSPFALSDYILLSEHEEQTPESFYDGKPVLYYHATGAKAWIPKSQRGKLPFFPADLSSAPTAPENSALSGQSEDCVEQQVDLFVHSRHLSIFCPAAQCGASIPYQQISIHAIKNLRSATSGQAYPSVYLQLELASGGASDDEFDTVELTLIPAQPQPTPPPPPPQPRPEGAPGEAQAAQPPQSEAAKLFEAISECSNLNPDPVQLGDEEEEDADEDGAQIIFEGDRDREAIEGFTGVFAGARDGGLPPAFPGSGGWITAENVHEFFDEEGNWIGSEGDEDAVAGELGEGAGTVHPRAEDEREVNGHGAGEGEGGSKRPRMDMTSTVLWQRVGQGPRARTRPRPRARLSLRSLSCLALAVFLFLWLVLPYDSAVRLAFRFNFKRLEAAWTTRPSERWVYAQPPPSSANFDLGRDVLVVLKTGYGTKDRVPAWFDALSNVNAFRDVLIIADYEGQGAQGDEDYPYSFKYRGERLRRIRKYNELSEAISEGDEALALQHCKSFGWELDAMKFMSGLEMAYQEFPDKKWYLLVDDDTFVIQPSLKPLLTHLNPRQPHYLGNAVGDFKARFAHGGSAVILSQAAMRALFKDPRALSSVYVDSLDETWGDRLLAKALLKLGIYLDETYSHLFNGEPPLLSKIRADRLCSPVLSFHKLASPAAMRELGDRFRDVSKPVLWNDLWEIYGHTPPWRQPGADAAFHQDWDHVGEPDESTLIVPDVSTAKACKKHCDRRARACLAWSWDPETQDCHISHWMIVGSETPGRVSGVNLPRAKHLEANCILY